LLESELFGHVRGSFTGASKDKKGLFEIADNGTIFLDEIGDTSLSMQVKLLRVLQDGTFIPVGGTSTRKINVRVICATNKNLKEMIEKGSFREDLFYRVNVISVHLPPLRERGDDVNLLSEFFLKKKCDERNLTVKELSKALKEKLVDYAWPGNVRELENEIERLIVLTGNERIIPLDILSPRIAEYGRKGNSTLGGVNIHGPMKLAVEALEKLMIKEGLKRCDFNKSKLAKELKISRASLIMKVEKYGLEKRKLSNVA
jgi:two-component system, NtrC family, response regulator HupR/HoxA